MIRKLFFLFLLLCLNSSCSMATLDAQTSDHSVEGSKEGPSAIAKENSDIRGERHREMILAKLDRMGKR